MIVFTLIFAIISLGSIFRSAEATPEPKAPAETAAPEATTQQATEPVRAEIMLTKFEAPMRSTLYIKPALPAPAIVTQPEEAPEGPAAEPQAPEKEYTYYDIPLYDEMQEYAQDICEKYDFPCYDIIAAMIVTESGCRETIVSATNDYGYMQINACNHKWLADELGITDFLDGRQNIEAGVYIIQGLYHKYEDIGKALMAYNCGEGGAANLWAQGVYSTQYSRLIQQRAAELVERTSP